MALGNNNQINPNYQRLRTDWKVDDSSFNSYTELVRFPSDTAKDLIHRHIGKNMLNTALDLAGGSNGRAIADLIDDGYIGAGIFTNLTDNRTRPVSDNGIHLMDGNLLQNATWNRIKDAQQRLSPGGFDLVLHRPYGALQELSAAQYIRYARTILGMLKPGGVFYTQVPSSYAYGTRNEPLIDEICEGLRSISEIDSVEVTDPRSNLADHDFCLISKKS